MLKLSAASLLVLAATLAATTASAQTTFHFGLRAGGNLAQQTLPKGGEPPFFVLSSESSNSALLSGQAGLVFEARFGRLAFQPALLFSQKGVKSAGTLALVPPAQGQYSYDYTDWHTTTRTNWLELPLNFVYTPKIDRGFQVFGGPYVALGIGGRQISSGLETSSGGAPRRDISLNSPVVYGSGNYQRFDAGVNLGIGYRAGPLQLQAGYGLGLRSLFTATDCYNRVAQLTATYFWGK